MKKKMEMVLSGLLFVMMTVGLIFSPAMAAKAIELTINEHNPEVTAPGQALKYWAQKVEEQCQGKVKMTIHFAGALLKGDEAFRGIQTGVAAAGHYVLNRQEGFLLNTVMSLPFMGWPSQKETAKIYRALMAKFPELGKEWKNLQIVGMVMMPPTAIHTAKKPIRKPEDLKGLKIFGAEYATVQAINAAGATPVQLDIADMYMSLDRGLINGVVNHFPTLSVFGVLKLLPYHTILGEGGINMTPMLVIMNKDILEGLPEDVRNVILNSNDIYAEKLYEEDGKMLSQADENCKKWKHTMIKLTPEEVKVWYDMVKGPIHDKWISECEAKGLPGKAVYEEALRLIQEANAKP